jgi:predicted SAM-dependent methyltransferase
LAVEVFEHLLADDVTPTLKSALAVLRPGGTLIITTPDNERLSHNMCVCPDCHAIFHRWQHQQNFSREKFAQLVKSAGFSHVKFLDFNVVPRFVPGPLQGIARAMLIWAKKKSGRHVTLITLATK